MSIFTHHRRNIFLALLAALLVLVTTMSAHAAGSPVANVSKSSNLSGTMPLNVNLDGSLSSCPNGCTQPTSYVWDYGDTVPSQPGITQTHGYDFAGVYTATLTITDNLGLTSKASVTVTVNLPPGESLASYVQACKTQLNFQTIPDNVDCYSGDLFQTANDFDQNASVNDYMGYRKITDQVDMAFACRWLFGNPVNDRRSPISIEMLVHNRQNGNTCFFSAKGFVSHSNIDPANRLSRNPPSIITSPTASTAASFWDSPSAVNVYVRCIGCHVEGPYIATPTIAPFLAKDGLMNNGHDTGSNITNADLTQLFNRAHVKYHAVVTPNANSVFSSWDSLKQSYMNPSDSGCSMGCHVIGTSSPQQDITQLQRGPTTILHDPANQLLEIDHAGVMAPFDDGSNYRWINLGIPDGGVESESFAGAMNARTTLVPTLLSNCAAPGALEAHAVGVPANFGFNTVQMAQLPDRLRTFNLKEGLVCLNSDQEPGHPCGEYSIRYLCSVSNTDGTATWSGWYNTDSASGDGDHEERSRDQNICGGINPIAIEAEEVTSGNKPIDLMGPNDRLARFSPYGLTCNASDQVDGKCSNYVVRYDACSSPPSTQPNKTLTNVFAVGKQVTAAGGSLAKGQSHNGGTTQQWNTQQWNLEPITNTEYVRVHNPGTNVYLTVTSTAEQATVATAASNTTASEMWAIETISGSSAFRLKNLFSGKYLTIADPKNFPSTPDFLPIYSQGLNTGWTSQHWLIQ